MFRSLTLTRLARRSFISFAGPPTKTAGPLHLKVLKDAQERMETVGKSIDGTSTATISCGCFWGPELAFQRVPGVTRTAVGYTSGHDPLPTYNKVCSGSSGHTEAVQVDFDPRVVTFEELLVVFWDIHDGTQLNRQGNDVGTQYRSGIYWHTVEQKNEADAMHANISEQLMERIGAPLATEIVKLDTFHDAEKEHQQYLERGGQRPIKMCTDPIRCYG
jgi:methionine-S-sulfoxide reductase